jgi:poly(3-hydroxybutyrate) depolymerase
LVFFISYVVKPYPLTLLWIRSAGKLLIMTRSFYVSCLFLFWFGISGVAQAQQVFKTTSSSVIGYLEYLPDGYHSATDNYPVVIFLHGIGERGPASTDPDRLKDGVSLLTRNGPPRHVKNGTKFPFILISPQLKSSFGGWPAWYVMEVIEHVRKNLRIDKNRIYLTGLSMGGFGTWTAAQEYPDFFAAVAPVCGGGNTAKAKAIADANLPVWAFHGDADNIVSYKRSVAMVEEINRYNPDPKAKLTIYKGVKHNSWDNAYRTDNSLHKPNVYQWLLSHRRNQKSETKPANVRPIVDAGKDRTVSSQEKHVKIKASAHDSDGKIASYRWTKVSGGDVKMTNTDTDELLISDFSAGAYVFKVSVKDNHGAEASDEVSVTVRKEESKSTLTAFAGNDRSITLPTNQVTLQGSAKSEGGMIMEYAWRKAKGGTARLSGEKSSRLSVEDLEQGEYVFELKVKNDRGISATDHVKVVVKKKPANQAPVADAGRDMNISLPVREVVINGKGHDHDGKIVSYIWSKRSGGTVKMSDTKTPDLKVSDLQAGKYVFRLSVKDNEKTSRWDEMVLVVTRNQQKSSAPKKKLIADAGRDKTVTLPVHSLHVKGGVRNSSGKIAEWKWTQVGGQKVNMHNVNKPTLAISGLQRAGKVSFRLYVKDRDGRTAVDHVRIFLRQPPTRVSSDTTEVVQITNEPDDQPDLAPLEGNGVDLFGSRSPFLEDCIVVVYNDRGEQIYRGRWDGESSREVFSEPGFYIYHVLLNSKRVEAGKIMIRP